MAGWQAGIYDLALVLLVFLVSFYHDSFCNLTSKKQNVKLFSLHLSATHTESFLFIHNADWFLVHCGARQWFRRVIFYRYNRAKNDTFLTMTGQFAGHLQAAAIEFPSLGNILIPLSVLAFSSEGVVCLLNVCLLYIFPTGKPQILCCSKTFGTSALFAEKGTIAALEFKKVTTKGSTEHVYSYNTHLLSAGMFVYGRGGL